MAKEVNKSRKVLANNSSYYTMTQPEQHPPWLPLFISLELYTPGVLPELAMTGLPVCCSCATLFNAKAVKMQKEAHLVILSDLADKVREGFIDVDALFGGCFDEFTAKVFGEVATL